MSGVMILFVVLFCMGSVHAELIWLLLRDKISPEGSVVLWDFSRSDYDVREQDFPVRKDYISEIEEIGVRVRITSRWINAVSVDASEYQRIQLSKLKFKWYRAYLYPLRISLLILKKVYACRVW